MEAYRHDLDLIGRRRIPNMNEYPPPARPGKTFDTTRAEPLGKTQRKHRNGSRYQPETHPNRNAELSPPTPINDTRLDRSGAIMGGRILDVRLARTGITTWNRNAGNSEGSKGPVLAHLVPGPPPPPNEQLGRFPERRKTKRFVGDLIANE